MKLSALLLAFVASVSFAHGSSHPQAGVDGSNVVNAASMPRARIWGHDRLWQTVDGQILVCDEQFTNGYNKECYAKGDKGEQTRWSPLATKTSDGMVLKGYEYRFIGSGGALMLIAYYGPVEPAKAEPARAPTVVFNGPIEVHTGSVIIRRNLRTDKVKVQRVKPTGGE